MSKPLSLRGKFILFVVVFSILAVFLYLLEPRIDSAIFFFFFFPILIILLGKLAELIIRAFERISTGPLSLIEPRNTFLLFCYYVSLSIFLAVLIENSALLSLLNFRPNEWQVALISLSLGFLPRVLSYASGIERARNTLLAIFTPLTLTAAVTLLTQPATLAYRLQTLELCIVGSLIQVLFGDLALYFAGFLGIIHPIITIETISLLDLRRLIYSQLETIQWNQICEVLKEAKQVNRVDIIDKILESMKFFIHESRKRRAKLARAVFVNALIKTIHSEPNLQKELASYIDTLKKDKEAEVRARIACCYGIMSREMPDKSLRSLSELLNDKDLRVLHEVGMALVIVSQVNSKAVLEIIKLSLNPVFLGELMKLTSMPIQTRVQLVDEYGFEMEHVSLEPSRRMLHYEEDPILKALKAAYTISPKDVFEHLKKCSSDKDIRLRVLVAAIISDSNFIQNDKKLLQIEEKVKKDRDPRVKNALKFFPGPIRLRQQYYSRALREGKSNP